MHPDHPIHPIHVFINKTKYALPSPVQTGASLKQLAGIALGDVLFLQQPGDDKVIGNDTTITLRNGDHLHSQPPADYGLGLEAAVQEAGLPPERVSLHDEAGGWVFVVLSEYQLPEGYHPDRVQLLVKLPPTFPDAAPDMFWVFPEVKAPTGTPPRGASMERIWDRDWQRFSWHLQPGAWKPGVSTLRDFMRCIAGRFLRMD